jgi:hypothetical protein
MFDLRNAGLDSETHGYGYTPAGHVAVELVKELIRVPLDPSPPAANTRGLPPERTRPRWSVTSPKK